MQIKNILSLIQINIMDVSIRSLPLTTKPSNSQHRNLQN